MDDKPSNQQCEEDNDPDQYYVYAAKRGTLLEAQRIEYINWRDQRFYFALSASTFPSHWFAKNNYLHEAAIWYDGTCLFNHHSTKVGM